MRGALNRIVHHPLVFGLTCVLFSVGIGLLGYRVQQSDFVLLVAIYTPTFLLYLLLCQAAVSIQRRYFLFGLAVIARLLLLPSLPGWSDDLYRFIWDGRLIVHGTNPFEQLPSYYMEPGHRVSGLEESLYASLNSADYFTVYPPVAQGIFALAAWLSPQSILGSALVIRGFLLLCELGTIWLLLRLLRNMQMPEHKAIWYALNPLVILEVVGNLHFEGAMIFFLLLSFYFLQKQQLIPSAFGMALSIASKLVPLIFLVFWLRRLGWKSAFWFFGVLGFSLLLVFSPLLSGAFFQGMGSSLGLYFHQFEFNASLYYLARYIGYQLEGYNMIDTLGPLLALTTFVGVLSMALVWKTSGDQAFMKKHLFAICLYVMCSTTVHPWYAILPFTLSLFSSYRFPMLFTYFVVWSYAHYAQNRFEENILLIALEYSIIIGVGIGECWYLKKVVRTSPDKVRRT
ncbi:MAG TPA: glycosyltransferase 87 family protein [Saprospiraceae bacterium]|nr:glycosyltransferase 87 family protein [Saprospiraceae bacterium]HMQ82425.1 glycosyltransferase 87 family protein [Saprospiraceae bacterium]